MKSTDSYQLDGKKQLTPLNSQLGFEEN